VTHRLHRAWRRPYRPAARRSCLSYRGPSDAIMNGRRTRPTRSIMSPPRSTGPTCAG
jgi:hypothetical protein